MTEHLPSERTDAEDRQRRLESLRQGLASLHPAGESTVFGEGDPAAALVVVGEAPGGEEEREGRPFVGAAGKILSQLLAEAGLPRDRVWITNVVKVRPTRGSGARRANRPPTTAEIQVDLPILLAELQAIRPRVVVCLGNVAAGALIHRDFRMREEHGRSFNHPLGFRAMATYHPAFVLRQSGEARDEMEKLMTDDLARARLASLDS